MAKPCVPKGEFFEGVGVGFDINHLGLVAAEIVNLDCSRPFSDDTLRVVKQAFATHPVLIFRGQTLTPREMAAFGRQFGPLEGYDSPFARAGATASIPQTNLRRTPDQTLYRSPDDPDVLIMTNETRADLDAIGIVDNAEIWHSDGSHKREPSSAIIVYVVRNPAAGGETEFCDMRAIHDSFNADMRAKMRDLIGIHHWSKSRNPRFAGTLDDAAIAEGDAIARRIPEMPQPLIRTLPESGRFSVYASPRFTVRVHDLPTKASDAVLNGIFTLMEEPVFHYRHEWRDGDLVIWDNRCLNHRVSPYSSADIRCRLRVSVAGDAPE